MKTDRLCLIKIIFCLQFLALFNNCFGQDTITHYPELKKKGTYYLYGDKQMNEAEIQTQLILLGNAEITKQVQLAKKSKDLQGIGYFAIPLGIFATYLGIASQPFLWNPYDPEKENISQLCYGATFLVLTSSVHFKIDSNKKNAKAIRLYNASYCNQ